jgi:hypothetical protein
MRSWGILVGSMRGVLADGFGGIDKTIYQVICLFQIFELPALPAAFVTTKGKRRLEVTLAYDPPTRASRADNYLGVTMAFSLWKNVGLEGLRDAFKKWNPDEKAGLDEDENEPALGDIKNRKIELLPKATRRQTSTVQHGWKDISRAGNLAPEQPLYLVVVCQRNWAPAHIERQRFAGIMSLWHEDTTVDLQAAIRIQPKIQAEVQLRADQLRVRSRGR